MMNTDPQLADFINNPPEVFLEMTSGELLSVVGIASSIGMTIGTLLGGISQSMVLGVFLFALCTALLTIVFSNVVRKNKQNRPSNYLRERWHRWRSQHGLWGSELIDVSQPWSLGKRPPPYGRTE